MLHEMTLLAVPRNRGMFRARKGRLIQRKMNPGDLRNVGLRRQNEAGADLGSWCDLRMSG
jgi:hypothetical protein